MSRKSRVRRREGAEGQSATGDKARAKAGAATTPEALKRRRNRRFLVVGLIALSFPLFELVAYQFRAITITLINRSDVGIKRIKVMYSGGEFDAPELKPGGSLTRLIRPNFSFKGDHFSTYNLSIRFAADDGGFYNQMGRVGALDFSSQETYTVTRTPVEGAIQLQHTSKPGFPLSLVRDLLERLGLG